MNFIYNMDYYDGLALFATGFIVILLILAAIWIVKVIALWKVFQKAGKPGWASIIPFYSTYVLTEIAGLHWMYFLLIIADLILMLFNIDTPGLSLIASLASLYASFAVAFNLSKRFNKGIEFTICLFLFAPICYMILAFSKDCVYDGNILVSEHAMFGDTNNSRNNNSNQNNVIQPLDKDETGKVNSTVDKNQNAHNFCANCGTRVDANSKFCQNCGNEITR